MEIAIDGMVSVTSCDHTHRIPVRYVAGAGRAGVRLQCQRCGQTGGNVKTNGYNVDKLPPFDQSLVDRWDRHCRAAWDEKRQRQQDEWQSAQAEKRAAWFAKYNVYLQSAHWRAVRRRVIARDEFTCQLCHRRVEANTAEVHHLSYDTYNQVGQSLPAECVTLCRVCHERIESAKRGAE